MTTIRPPICLGCARFRDEADLACDAFPRGIPEEIIFSQHDHRKPFDGDKGIRFEPIDAAAARRADEIF